MTSPIVTVREQLAKLLENQYVRGFSFVLVLLVLAVITSGRNDHYKSNLDRSISRHSFVKVNMAYMARMRDAIVRGSVAEGMFVDEALQSIDILLAAMSSFHDVNETQGVQGTHISMRDKRQYFEDQNTKFSDAQEEKLLSGIVSLFQGGAIASGILGMGMNVDAVRHGVDLLELFVANQDKGDVLAAYEAFSASSPTDAVQFAGKVAVACQGNRSSRRDVAVTRKNPCEQVLLRHSGDL